MEVIYPNSAPPLCMLWQIPFKIFTYLLRNILKSTKNSDFEYISKESLEDEIDYSERPQQTT